MASASVAEHFVPPGRLGNQRTNHLQRLVIARQLLNGVQAL